MLIVLCACAEPPPATCFEACTRSIEAACACGDTSTDGTPTGSCMSDEEAAHACAEYDLSYCEAGTFDANACELASLLDSPEMLAYMTCSLDAYEADCDVAAADTCEAPE